MKYYQLLEIAAFIICLTANLVVRHVFLRIILSLLFITLANEIVVVPYLNEHLKFYKNVAYNIFSLIDMFLWFLIFYITNDKRAFKKMVLASAVLCFAYTFIELTFLKSWEQLHPDSFRFYNLTIITWCFVYFNKIIKKNFHDALRDELFWILGGNFLFHLVFFVNLTTMTEKIYWEKKDTIEVFYFLHNLANTFYYSSICIACFVFFFKFRNKKAIYSQNLLPL